MLVQLGASALPFHEIVLRLCAAGAFGLVLGLDREMKQKPAGLKTHVLVGLGSAALIMIALELPPGPSASNSEVLSRVMQGLITGIGFLGGGVILRSEREQTVRGLTTAATVWLVACLGMACGVGHWRIAIAAGALTLVTLRLGDPLERLLSRVPRLFGAASSGRPRTEGPE